MAILAINFSVPASNYNSQINKKQPIISSPEQQQPKQQVVRCLKDNEVASYEIKKKKNEVSKAIIFIKEKQTGNEINNFEIELLSPDHYHSVELHKCGVYAAKSFNYDYITHKSLPGYKAGIWKYNYYGNGEEIVITDEDSLGNLGGYKHFFSIDFRVSPDEQYVVLVKGYLGSKEYSLVIKDLNTKEDIFILKLSDIMEKYPDVAGSFGMIEWKENGRYFWTDIFEGAYTPGYVRIDTTDWSWEVFTTPKNAMGGFEPNYKTGWMPYAPDTVWTGIVETNAEIRKEAKARGQTSSLYLYNIFTKQQIKIYETAIDPIWNFGPPTWNSDTELQYKLPNGEKRIYKVK